MFDTRLAYAHFASNIQVNYQFEQELVTNVERDLPPLPGQKQMEIRPMMFCAPNGSSNEAGCYGLRVSPAQGGRDVSPKL
jgi:hypothetical protein